MAETFSHTPSAWTGGTISQTYCSTCQAWVPNGHSHTDYRMVSDLHQLGRIATALERIAGALERREDPR